MNLVDELRARGFLEQLTDEEGLRALLERGPTTVYAGFDPSADSLHCGSLVPLFALAHFQRAGHKVLPLMGGATGLIGDPTGKTELRKLLTREDVERNLAGIARQVERLLVLDGEKGKLVNNIDWFGSWSYLDLLREVGVHFSVNRMLATKSYQERYESENGLNFIEFNYQLLQATDFLKLYETEGCHIQLGGNDQWGNICAGVDLIRRVLGTEASPAEAYGVTFPLLTTASGRKMGKSESGAIWIDGVRTSPHDFFQYWRNADDADVERFLKLFTFLPLDEIAELAKAEGQAINAVKERLAWEVTALIHGAEEADKALAGARGVEDALPTVEVARAEVEAGLGILHAFAKVAELASSNGEVRRAIQAGGAKVNDERVSDPTAELRLSDFGEDGTCVLRIGKKKVKRLKLR